MPTPVVSSVGPIITRRTVEQAYLTVLTDWLGFYLSELEAQNGLPQNSIPRPPSPESYYGGVRMDSAIELTWTEDQIPVIIVAAEPLDPPVHMQFSYQQRFRVTVFGVVIGEDEPDGRLQADMYGGAIMAAILQDNTNLGGIAPRTDLEAYPSLAYADDNRREIQATSLEFATLITPVISEAGRPANNTWPPIEIPQVGSTSLTVDTLAS